MTSDVGRSVVQCSCGRAVPWRGEDVARAAGWRSRWLHDAEGFATVRVWCCPDCEVPMAPSPVAAPSYMVPGELVNAAVYHPGDVRALLSQLLVVDRPRGEAYARFLMGCAGAKAAKSWRKWAVEVGIEADLLQNKPIRKNRPTARRKHSN